MNTLTLGDLARDAGTLREKEFGMTENALCENCEQSNGPLYPCYPLGDGLPALKVNIDEYTLCSQCHAVCDAETGRAL